MIILLSLFMGFSIVLSTLLNGALANRKGIIPASWYNFSIGTLSILIFIAFYHFLFAGNLYWHWLTPRWSWGGGFIGMLVVLLFGAIAHKMKATTLMILPFIAQLVAAMIYDGIVMHLFSPRRFLGALLLLLGLWIYTGSSFLKASTVKCPQKT